MGSCTYLYSPYMEVPPPRARPPLLLFKFDAPIMISKNLFLNDDNGRVRNVTFRKRQTEIKFRNLNPLDSIQSTSRSK